MNNLFGRIHLRLDLGVATRVTASSLFGRAAILLTGLNRVIQLSIQAMAWAIEQQEVTEPSTRLLLICLCNYADPTGDSIYPSIKRLSRDTGLSERAVQYQINKLKKAGVLYQSNPAIAAAKISRADKRPNCYRIFMTGRNPLHPAQSRGATKDKTGCNLKQNGVQPIAPDPSVIRHLTSSDNKDLRAGEARLEALQSVKGLLRGFGK